jgi:GT2 family glycosyltransferase
MTREVDVTAILVSYNTEALLPEALGALKSAAAGLSLQIVIIDNNSRDGSVALLQRDFSDCELIVNRVNVGFGRANNQALDRVQGRYVLLLNTDAFVAADTLNKTVGYMHDHPRCGILGVKLIGRDGEAQPSARYFPTPWNLFLLRTGLNRIFTHVQMVDDPSWDYAAVRQCDWVTGCYYLVRKQVIDQLGLFDPRYFLYCEEVDHCLAAKKAGWEIVCYPHTSVVHLGGESAKTDGEITLRGRQIELAQVESELLYFRKNHGAAGVWMHVALAVVGGAIVLTKRLLRWQSPIGFGACMKNIALMWSLFSRTDWGRVPTR